jgi:MFS transporter, PPP family, 3-phenylpropionic acid transporter
MFVKENIMRDKLSVLYLVVCGSMACYYPYMTIYYQHRGLNYSQMGLLFAVNSLVAVISQPFWGIITDKYLNKRKSFLLVLGFSSILVIGFIFVKSYLAILLWVITFMIFQSPTLSINDAFCYEVIDSYKTLQYGKLRLMGSIGYAFVALAIAYVIKWTSIDSSFIAFALLGLLGIIVLRGINIKGKASKSSIEISDIVSIIRNKKFVILVMSALLVSASMSANSNFLGTLIQKTGGDVSKIGYLWFVVAMSELPAFFFGSKLLRKFGVLNIYYICLVFYISRFFLDSLCVNYQAVIAIQLFQSITYPLYIMATLQCINEIVAIKTRTTAITVFAALTAGVGGFVGNMSSGMVIQNYSVFLLFRIMSVLCIISLAIGLLLKASKEEII